MDSRVATRRDDIKKSEGWFRFLLAPGCAGVWPNANPNHVVAATLNALFTERATHPMARPCRCAASLLTCSFLIPMLWRKMLICGANFDSILRRHHGSQSGHN